MENESLYDVLDRMKSSIAEFGCDIRGVVIGKAHWIGKKIKIKLEMFPVRVLLLRFQHSGTGHCFIGTEVN